LAAGRFAVGTEPWDAEMAGRLLPVETGHMAVGTWDGMETDTLAVEVQAERHAGKAAGTWAVGLVVEQDSLFDPEERSPSLHPFEVGHAFV
jgi:hypothetical protein